MVSVAPPRVRYVHGLTGPHDVGIVKPWFQRMAGIIL